MATGTYSDRGSGVQSMDIFQAYSSLPAEALASRVPSALAFYDYAQSDPAGMNEMAALLETRTPLLSELRHVFRDEYLEQQLASPVAEKNAVIATIEGEEFDITLLAFYCSEELRGSLANPVYEGLMYSGLRQSFNALTRHKPRDIDAYLEGRYPRFHELSLALAQSAFDRVVKSDPAVSKDAERSDSVGFEELSDAGKAELVFRCCTHHLAILSLVSAIWRMGPQPAASTAISYDNSTAK